MQNNWLRTNDVTPEQVEKDIQEILDMLAPDPWRHPENFDFSDESDAVDIWG